jgi:hypothetical protein
MPYYHEHVYFFEIYIKEFGEFNLYHKTGFIRKNCIPYKHVKGLVHVQCKIILQHPFLPAG